MSEGESGTPAIFLDRDGTIMYDTGYPRLPADVRLVPGVSEALSELQRRGFALVIISNQSGVGRGMLTRDDVRAVHARMEQCLSSKGVQFTGTYYCYDAPDAATEHRKPGPGMLLQARTELGISMDRSFMVGDKASDVEAGKRAGCRTIFFRSPDAPAGAAPVAADHVARSWPEVIQIVSQYENL